MTEVIKSEGGVLQLSRNKIELFTECPRCFYREFVYGVGHPRSPSLKLNNAVDFLLKREFDTDRMAGTPASPHDAERDCCRSFA